MGRPKKVLENTVAKDQDDVNAGPVSANVENPPSSDNPDSPTMDYRVDAAGDAGSGTYAPDAGVKVDPRDYGVVNAVHYPDAEMMEMKAEGLEFSGIGGPVTLEGAEVKVDPRDYGVVNAVHYPDAEPTKFPAYEESLDVYSRALRKIVKLTTGSLDNRFVTIHKIASDALHK